MNDSNTEMFSLADLADIDVTEVAMIRGETLPAGVYQFKVLEAELDETTNRDDDPRIRAVFKHEVVGVVTVLGKAAKAPDFDPEELVGKTYTDRLYIVPDEGQKKALEGIGRVKAYVFDLGCENNGTLSDIVAATVDHTFEAKIVERPNPNDRSSPFAQLKLEKRKA